MELTVKALMLKYESDKATAVAELNILLTTPVGVSKHMDVIAECDLRIETITMATVKIQVLSNIIPGSENNANVSPKPAAPN